MVFPLNFGFIPSTLAEDGDPLDILILNEEPLVHGCLIKAELVAVLKAEQKEEGKKERNDRLIGRAISKQTPASLQSLELNAKALAEIEYFFQSYAKLGGKRFKILGKYGPKKAHAIVQKAATSFLRSVK
jgi:inorganic pyrophosphatase